jgi:hypothetical protein
MLPPTAFFRVQELRVGARRADPRDPVRGSRIAGVGLQGLRELLDRPLRLAAVVEALREVEARPRMLRIEAQSLLEERDAFGWRRRRRRRAGERSRVLSLSRRSPASARS